MTGRTSHIHRDDEALMARWLEDHSSEAMEALVEGCAVCRARAAEIGRWLEAVRSAGAGEADEAFSPGRLAHQKKRLLRRLAEMAGDGTPARVLAFPVRDVAVARVPRWTPRRLVATAAVAGLITGVMAGSLIDRTPRPIRAGSLVAATAPAEVSVSHDPHAVHSEEAFLIELDNALDGSRVQELRALDAFTPSVLEASLVLP
jgi:hypothetical protein